METKEKICLIRKSLGWSQEVLGSTINLSQSQYGRIENSRSKFCISKFEEICKIWDITQAEFHSMSVDGLCDTIKERQKKKPPGSST